MSLKQTLAAALTGAAAFVCPALAQDLWLASPVDCALGRDCFIQQYVDHDDSRRASDYRCASLSYDGHTGTDFALPTLRDMRAGVNVLASAAGTVRGVRDGMPDQLYSNANAEQVTGRECGNGVAITHPGGWETQYCHLRSGSIAVRSGDRVAAGKVLGQIGLSGRTQFPHVHLTVRKNGAVVDPFDPDGRITCGAPSAETLWISAPAYQAGGLLDVGFADRIPDYSAVKAGRASASDLPATAPALVVFGYAFGGRRGDQMRLTIVGPDGAPFTDHTEDITRNQAQFFRATGRERRAQAWPAGIYRARVQMIRNGVVLSEQSTRVRVRP
ncbi:MAG: M23 family metallopeptidase [Pseudomonadota bacterium]